MIRGIVILIFRRAMQRIIELTLRLFLQFGLRFEMATSSVATTEHSSAARNASPVNNRELASLSPTASSSRQTPSSSSSLSTLQDRASNERDHRVLAMLMFLGYRLPSILGGAGKVSFMEYFATSRDGEQGQGSENVDKCMFRSRMDHGVTVYRATAASNHAHPSMDTPLSARDDHRFGSCSAIAVVCMPWESAKTIGAFCERLSEVTGSDVVHVVVPIGHLPSAKRCTTTTSSAGAALANATVEALLGRLATASSVSACTSLRIVSSALAAAVALHAVVRAPFQDGLVPIRGVVLIDPLVSVDSPPWGSMQTTTPDGTAAPLLAAATPPTSFFDSSVIKKMVVDGAARACSASNREGGSINNSNLLGILTQWFPPPLDDAFTIPILVIYDVDGLWAEEMKAYFTRWPGCRFLVESVPYRLHPSGSHSGRLFFATSRSSWATTELEVASAHMVLWLRDVVSPWEDVAGQSGSSRPVSGCSTPWTQFPPPGRRHSLLHSDPQRISLDSMEGIFSGFNESSLTGLPPSAGRLASANGQVGRRSPNGGFSLLTPQLWNPPAADTLAPSSSTGANLDSLGFQPPQVLARIPHVASRSAVSEEGLCSSATTP